VLNGQHTMRKLEQRQIHTQLTAVTMRMCSMLRTTSSMELPVLKVRFLALQLLLCLQAVMPINHSLLPLQVVRQAATIRYLLHQECELRKQHLY
jgi:hypothetical protein